MNKRNIKAYQSAYYNANREKILARSLAWYKNNQDRKKIYDEKYRTFNKEQIKLRQKAYRNSYPAVMKKWRIANREKLKEYDKARHYADVKKSNTKSRTWYVANKEKAKIYLRTYRLENPEKHCSEEMRRYSKKINAVPIWADRQIIDDFYAEASYQGLQVDHMVPLQSRLVCGLHCEDNLQLLSGKENVSKGNRYWPDQ